MRFSIALSLLILFSGLSSGTAFAAETSADPDPEIIKLKRELTRIQDERRRNKESFITDRKDFAGYTERTSNQKTRIIQESDSLHRQIVKLAASRDSLAALILASHAGERDIEIGQDNFRAQLTASCDSLSLLTARIPASSGRQIGASIALLRGELTAKTIDNTEACGRLIQMINLMEDACGTIQISQEPSPVPDIRGTVYRLRIGSFFEAVVDLKGEKCALWNSRSTNTIGEWLIAVDQKTAAEIYRAALIREGKMLPSLVTLPLTPAMTKEGGQ